MVVLVAGDQMIRTAFDVVVVVVIVVAAATRTMSKLGSIEREPEVVRIITEKKCFLIPSYLCTMV